MTPTTAEATKLPTATSGARTSDTVEYFPANPRHAVPADVGRRIRLRPIDPGCAQDELVEEPCA
jgi:hypothetical protein